VRRRPGLGALLLPLLAALLLVAALLHGADLHGSGAVLLLRALRLVTLLGAVLLLRVGGPAAAGGLLAGRHDGSALRRLQRGGALDGLHVRADRGADAVEVDVNQV
jgi:hypothetical protein